MPMTEKEQSEAGAQESQAPESALEKFRRLSKVANLDDGDLAELGALAETMASDGDPEALFWLGMAKLFGRHGYSQNPALGLDLLLRASEAGHREARIEAAETLLEPRADVPLPKEELDPGRAIDLLKSILPGAWHSYALKRLGDIYDQGLVVKADPVTATDYYRRSADAGLITSMLRYAQRLVVGTGVEKNRELAHQWFEKAYQNAEKYLEEDDWRRVWATNRLGESWLHGYGGRRNLSQGLKLLKQAAAADEHDEKNSKDVAAKDAAETLALYRQKYPDPDQALADSIDWQEPLAAYKRIINIAHQYETLTPEPLLVPHMILRGADGTGRMRFARLIALKLAEIGFLEHGDVTICDMLNLTDKSLEGRDRPDLERGGLILLKDTRPIIPKWEDTQRYEKQTLDWLRKYLEDGNRRTIFALSADRDKEGNMDRLLRLDPDFARYFSQSITFGDFSADKVAALFERIASQAGFSLDPEAKPALQNVIQIRLKQNKPFEQNALLATSLLQDCAAERAQRSYPPELEKSADGKKRLGADIFDSFSKPKELGDVTTLLQPLMRLVGLQDVKEELSGLVSLLAVQRQRQAAALPILPINLHMVFKGQSGTGKTSVARLLGKILYELGYLSKGHVIETDRGGLVGEYIGQTEVKTKEMVDKADGGILFIDEAYALAKAESGRDFGQEAIATLLKLMEDRRERFIVIAAGYTKEMQTFLDTNSGLRSRFARIVNFPDYSLKEMLEILTQIASDQGYSLSPEALKKVEEGIGSLDEAGLAAFSNGRGLRNVLERSALAQARRLSTAPVFIDKDVLMTIDAADITLPERPPERRRIGF